MAKTFSFRISLENIEQLKQQLESLGPAGAKALDALNQASPQLRDNLRQAREEAEKHGAAMKAVAQTHSATASGMMPLNMRMAELGHSARASMDSLAAGMPITRVLAMEVPRVAQAFGLMSAILNPVTLGLVATGAAMAVVGSRMAALSAETRGYQVLLTGMGTAAGNSAIQIQGLARSLETSGFGRDDATAAVQSMIRARTLPTAMFGTVAQLGLDASAVTGEAPVKQVEAFTRALTGGYDSLIKLDDEFNVLSQSERQSIRVMAEHGEQAAAMQVVIKALQDRFKGLHTESMSEVDKAFHEIGVAYNKMVDDIAKNPITIKAVLSVTGDLKKLFSGDLTPLLSMSGAGGAAIAAVGAAASSAHSKPPGQGSRPPSPWQTGRPSSGSWPSAMGIDPSLADAYTAARQTNPVITYPSGDHGDGLPRSAGPDDQLLITSTKKTNDKLAQIAEQGAVARLRGVDKAIAEGALRASEYIRSNSIEGANNKNRITAAFEEEARRAYAAAHANDNGRLGLNASGALATASAYLSSPAAGASAEAARKGALDALKDSTDAARQAQQELNLAQAESLIAGAKHVNELEREAEAQKAVADAARQGAAALREAKLAASIDKETAAQRAILANPGASPEARGIAQSEIDRTSGAMREIDYQRIREQVGSDLAARQLAMEKALEKESLIGLSSKDLATRSAQIDFRYQLRGQGLSGAQLDGAYGEGADIVGKTAAATQALTDYEDRMKAVKSGAADFSRAIATGFEDAVLHGKNFKSVLLSVSQDLERIALRMMVTKPMEQMFSGLMGGMMGGGSGGGGFGSGFGIMGSLFGRMFGGGGSLQGPMLDGSTLDQAGGGIASWFSGLFGGFADGGIMDQGRLYAVNENSTAPGLFIPMGPGRIDPAPGAMPTPQGVSGGGGHTVIINMNGVSGEPSTIRRSANQAAAVVHRSISAATRRSA